MSNDPVSNDAVNNDAVSNDLVNDDAVNHDAESKDADHRFTTRTEFESHFMQCVALSKSNLSLFDPDFAVFPLGSSATDAALRHFLGQGGHLQIAMHRTEVIERQYPRFLRLLKDYSHRIECRVTSRPLRTLTDSFCIGDGIHIVRRFHSDHMRGEAVMNAPLATEISRERFVGIWAESLPGLHATTTGL
jgi:hypothetical protein